MKESIVVLDFGSQYAHLIAKRFRFLGYYSRIADPNLPIEDFRDAKGLVLSGGPSSLYDKNAPQFNKDLLNLPIPILGLCYGHYVLQAGYGGKVGQAKVGEFGYATLQIMQNANCPLFIGLEKNQQVWMSHKDEVQKIAEGFEIVAQTKDCSFAAMQDIKRKRFSLQFHCEVQDTPCGNIIFKNFATYCNMKQNWQQDTVLSNILENIKSMAKDKNVLLFLSGGVDSTVTFALLNKALGKDRVLGLHIDNGFMRKNESSNIAKAYKEYGFDNFIVEDASAIFLDNIAGLIDPQKKRQAVGETFIKVRDKVVQKLKLDDSKWLLAQGTLYPDIIESGGTKNSNTIKTHHNRVEGIQKLLQQGLIIEPIKELYKDEVRLLGNKLGLANELIMRHPFPGPGLSINVLCSQGSLSNEDTLMLKVAQQELEKIEITQFCAKCSASMTRSVLPIKSVGVQGDFRTYRFPSVLTFAKEDGGFYHLPKKWEKIEAASSAVTNHSQQINRMILKLYQNPLIDSSAIRLQEGYCNKKRLDQLREVDNIVLKFLHESGYYNKIFQHLTISLPYASVSSHASFVLRPVVSEDVMTARFAHLDMDLLKKMVSCIAKMPFVDVIFYDCTNKPPATFGWE